MRERWMIVVDTVEGGLAEYEIEADGWGEALKAAPSFVGFAETDGYKVTKVAVHPKVTP